MTAAARDAGLAAGHHGDPAGASAPWSTAATSGRQPGAPARRPSAWPSSRRGVPAELKEGYANCCAGSGCGRCRRAIMRRPAAASAGRPDHRDPRRPGGATGTTSAPPPAWPARSASATSARPAAPDKVAAVNDLQADRPGPASWGRHQRRPRRAATTGAAMGRAGSDLALRTADADFMRTNCGIAVIALFCAAPRRLPRTWSSTAATITAGCLDLAGHLPLPLASGQGSTQPPPQRPAPGARARAWRRPSPTARMTMPGL